MINKGPRRRSLLARAILISCTVSALLMTSLAMFGMLLAVVAVLAAYGVGRAAGFPCRPAARATEKASRRGRAKDPCAATPSGSIAGRRKSSSGDEQSPARRGLGFGAVALWLPRWRCSGWPHSPGKSRRAIATQIRRRADRRRSAAVTRARPPGSRRSMSLGRCCR